MIHPALLSLIDQMAALVRDSASDLELDLADPKIRTAVYAVVLTMTLPNVKPTPEALTMAAAWQEACK